MTRGTKSILFGVHQFLWHPLTVARAWRYLYGRWPTFYQWIAIFCHDLGYWGKREMDSFEGQTHPESGAKIARRLAYWLARFERLSEENAVAIGNEIHDLCLFHSTHYAQMKGKSVSALFLPDKVCVLLDPPGFYLLRGRLSGEVYEYTARENEKRGIHLTPKQWLNDYREYVKRKADTYMDCRCDICLAK